MKCRSSLRTLTLAIITVILGAFPDEITLAQPLFSHEVDWTRRLYTPTFLTSYRGLFFIIDCWHGRVLWSNRMNPDLSEWRVMDDRLHGPHSMVGHGEYYFVDDTEAGAIQVYRKTQVGLFTRIATVPGLGMRPHRIQVDERTGVIVVLAANSQELFFIEGTPPFAVKERVALPFLDSSYTRSFTIQGDEIIFVSGPRMITVANISLRPMMPKRSYVVPRVLSSMNDIFYSGNFWYVTATPRQIVRVPRLEDLEVLGDYDHRLYEKLELQGTPYYLHQEGDQIIIPEITEWSGFTSFRENGEDIWDLHHSLVFGAPTASSIDRKAFIMAP